MSFWAMYQIRYFCIRFIFTNMKSKSKFYFVFSILDVILLKILIIIITLFFWVISSSNFVFGKRFTFAAGRHRQCYKAFRNFFWILGYDIHKNFDVLWSLRLLWWCGLYSYIRLFVFQYLQFMLLRYCNI